MRLLPEVAAAPVRGRLMPRGQLIAFSTHFCFGPRRRPDDVAGVQLRQLGQTLFTLAPAQPR